MAQGVAHFQQETVLKADGMAGPRTLPRLFESGLATEVDRKKFVKQAKGVEASWTELGTAEARADKLFEGVKALLDDEKVPTPSHGVKNLGKAAGEFKPDLWNMAFDRAALSPKNVDDDAARDVASTVYHEARHAEQQHKMARMRATQLAGITGKVSSAEQIHVEMGIPIWVAEDANRNPLPKGIEFATAAQQYDNVYGSGRTRHKRVEDEAPSNDELKAARAAVAADPSPANKAKLARLVAAFKAYHDLPTENDAFATAGDFQVSWDEATSTAKP